MEQNYLYMNTVALAFLGDAVYEVYVRRKLLEQGGIHADALHKKAVHYVRAEGQEKAVRALLPELTEEETGLVKRARNHKITSKPKNAGPVTYKWATAFEALLGYLHMAGQTDRLNEIMARAFDIAGGAGA